MVTYNDGRPTDVLYHPTNMNEVNPGNNLLFQDVDPDSLHKHIFDLFVQLDLGISADDEFVLDFLSTTVEDVDIGELVANGFLSSWAESLELDEIAILVGLLKNFTESLVWGETTHQGWGYGDGGYGELGYGGV